MILTNIRVRLLAVGLLAFLLPMVLAACSGDDPNDPGVGAVITPGVIITTAEPTHPPAAQTPGTVVTPVPTTSTAPAATPTPSGQNGDANLRGFIFPIAGGCLPKGDQLMPNAPRDYRNGVHEGVDFYGVDNCVAITRGTPVVAAKAGTVIRADLNYVNPTPQQMAQYLDNPNTDASLDAFRGRQVWIRHDDGSYYVTRYAHLDGIAPGITVGTRVTAGQVIAYVGESGTPESLTNPGTEYHLHFEMRVGSSFLGAGQNPATVRQLYTTLFSP